MSTCSCPDVNPLWTSNRTGTWSAPTPTATAPVPGEPRWDDDGYPAKIDLLVAERVSVVSFTFGLPRPADVRRLHDAGAEVTVTVTTPDEARQAAELGVDSLCVQGFEAGGHRGVFVDDPAVPTGGEPYGLLAALRLVAAAVDLPLVATGGIVHGAGRRRRARRGSGGRTVRYRVPAQPGGRHRCGTARRARRRTAADRRDQGVQRPARARHRRTGSSPSTVTTRRPRTRRCTA